VLVGGDTNQGGIINKIRGNVPVGGDTNQGVKRRSLVSDFADSLRLCVMKF